MKGWICFGLLLLVGTGILAPAASAQQKGDWLTGIYIGYTASLEEDAPSGDFGGLFYATNYINDVISLGEFADTLGGTSTVSQHIFALTADVRASGKGKLKPFANLGLGPYWVTTNGALLSGAVGASGTDTRFGFNLGGGLMYGGSTSKWSFGIDARWHQIIEGALDGSALDMVSVLVGFNVRE
jgi:hypothetical protein